MKRLTVFALLLTVGAVLAETSPLMLSLCTPIQVPTKRDDVVGLRISLLYGENCDVIGLDLGLAQRATGIFSGLELGGVNIVNGRLCAGQVGLVNVNTNQQDGWDVCSKGAQVGLVNYAECLCGAQDGIVNVSKMKMVGFRGGIFNYAEDFTGLQCGYWFLLGVNVAKGNVRGCQIGLVNYAETMEKGVQLGLVNIISNDGWLPFFPFINGHF